MSNQIDLCPGLPRFSSQMLFSAFVPSPSSSSSLTGGPSYPSPFFSFLTWSSSSPSTSPVSSCSLVFGLSFRWCLSHCRDGHVHCHRHFHFHCHLHRHYNHHGPPNQVVFGLSFRRFTSMSSPPASDHSLSALELNRLSTMEVSPLTSRNLLIGYILGFGIHLGIGIHLNIGIHLRIGIHFGFGIHLGIGIHLVHRWRNPDWPMGQVCIVFQVRFCCRC